MLNRSTVPKLLSCLLVFPSFGLAQNAPAKSLEGAIQISESSGRPIFAVAGSST